MKVIDQMARGYSINAASRNWPIYVFYNVIDLALINSWILLRDISKSSISRPKFIQLVVKINQHSEKHSATRRNPINATNLQ